MTPRAILCTTLTLLVVTLGIGAFALWLVAEHPRLAEPLGTAADTTAGMAGAIAAAATGLAAAAAWQSASASRDVSRDTQRALAYALRPQIAIDSQVENNQQLITWAALNGDLGAINVHMRVFMIGGGLAGEASGSLRSGSEERLVVPATGDQSLDFDEPPKNYQRAEVRFSDAQGLATWVQQFHVVPGRDVAGGRVLSHWGGSEPVLQERA